MDFAFNFLMPEKSISKSSRRGIKLRRIIIISLSYVSFWNIHPIFTGGAHSL